VNLVQEKVLVVSVLNWIKEHKLPQDCDAADITEEIDLITDGVLDSMGLVDLLLFVEEQTGRPIDLITVEPKDVCVVKNLCRIALGNQPSQNTDECEQKEHSCGDVLAAGGQV